jgi:hypothetical protein
VSAAEEVAEKEFEEAELAHAKSAAIWDTWKSKRHGIIHTLDISGPNSKAAQKIVRGFRNGLYYGNVDFHVGELSTFFEKRSTAASTHTPGSVCVGESNPIQPTIGVSATKEPEEEPIAPPHNSAATIQPFLSHIILDLPSAHSYLPLVTPHLHVSGKLVLFVPSITQIVDAVEIVKSLNLPLALDKVLELGPGISAGREWDVKAVKIRANEKRLKLDSVDGDVGREVEVKAAEKEYGIVCRPKVGVTVIGGGFLGVWSKMRKEDGVL